MKNRALLSRCVLGLVLGCVSLAGAEAPLGLVAEQQALLDMANGFRLMCVAAHPDDEDGATLAYYRKKFGVETHVVIATRGEGGQNEIGPELYNALGVIRTHEMQAAADVEGAVLHFLNMPEFGYSKTPEETFEIWGEDTALRRLVKLIREVRPHVIITHHGRMKDHGHHQAIGATVREAFSVAADGTVFPEHLEAGLKPWQINRHYIRDFNQAAEGLVEVPITELSPVWGKTYAEIAAEALDQHKSQGMGFFINMLLSGDFIPKYELMQEVVPESTAKPVTAQVSGALFAGLPNPIEAPLQLTQRSGKVDGRQLAMLQQVGNDVVPAAQRETLRHAVNVSSGFRLTLTPEDTLLTPDQQVEVVALFTDFLSPEAETVTFSLSVDSPIQLIGTGNATVDVVDGAAEARFTVGVASDAPPTVPHAPHLFDADFLKPQIHMHADLAGEQFVSTMNTSAYVDIAPPMESAFVDSPYLVIPGQADTLVLPVALSNREADAAVHHSKVFGAPGWKGTGERITVGFGASDETRIVQVPVTIPEDVGPGDYAFGVRLEGREADGALYPRNTLVRVVDVTVPEEIRVGVIQSYDDTYVKTLAKMGVDHGLIEAGDFSLETLAQYDTIIVDIRAYLVREDLVANNATLLDYVKAGGTVLVNYQKTFEWRPELAPYPIHLSRNRVTREDAAMDVLQPEHPIFTTPNVIGAGDWDGWLQERGLYFPSKWDDAYTPLIECHDPDEIIPPGSLLVADYGEGTYVYTALGWYRQLRELHPGALRVFANMLAL